MKVKQSKSISSVIGKLSGKKDQDPVTIKEIKQILAAQKKTMEDSAEMAELARQSKEAADKAYEESSGPDIIRRLKAIEAERKVKQEYMQVKSGVKGRAGDIIARALGLDEKETKLARQIFGKRMSKEEREAGEKKFKIGEPSERSKAQGSADRRAKKVLELNQKILDVLNTVRLSVEGIANKLRASPAKEMTTKGGQYFDAMGKRINKGKIEKQAGLKYEKTSQRFKDTKSGKFVSASEAGRRMNFSPSASKISAAPAPKATATKGGALASATAAIAGTGLASKVLPDEPIAAGPKDSKLAVDTNTNTKKILRTAKKIDKIADEVEDVLDMFTGKKLAMWFGAAIGAAVPFLVEGTKWIWNNIVSPGIDFGVNIAKQIGQWLAGIEIPEFTILGKSIGPFKPFGFLSGIAPAPTTPPPGAEPAPAPAPEPPKGAGAAAPAPAPAPKPAAPAPGKQAGAPSERAPAPKKPAGETPKPEPAVDRREQKKGSPAAPQRETTSSRTGTSMPGGAAPKTSVPKVSGMDDVKKMIKAHEGVRYQAYKDSLGLWTIGVGHLIGDGSDAALAKSGYKGRTLTEKEVDDLFEIDFAKHVKIAEKTPGWNLANDTGKAAMIDLAFNMGSWWNKFKNTAKSLASGDFASAADGLTNSAWFTQVGNRAKRIVAMIKGGGEENKTAANNPTPASEGSRIDAISGSDANTSSATQSTGSPTATPSGAPTASAVSPTPSSGNQLAAASTEVQSSREKAAAAPVILAANAGGKNQPQMPPQKPNNSEKAKVRSDEGSFNRALARDFSHPTAFTTASMV